MKKPKLVPLAKAVGLGVGALVGGPLLGAAGAMCGGLLAELLDEDDSFGIQGAVGGVFANLFSSKLEPLLADAPSGFNYDLRRAIIRCVAEALAWEKQPGPVATLLLSNKTGGAFGSLTPARREMLQRSFQRWHQHLSHHLHEAEKKEDPSYLDAVLPPVSQDQAIALADEALTAEPDTLAHWQRYFTDVLAPQLEAKDASSISPEDLQKEIPAALAATFPAQLNAWMKSPEGQRTWIAFQKVLLQGLRRTVTGLDQKIDQLLANDTLLLRIATDTAEDVKNILAGVRELLARQQPPPPVPLVSLHQLPPRQTDFVGRREDLEKLQAGAQAGAVITGLRGMGGIGKTALAVELAHEWAPRFPDAQLMLRGQGVSANPPSAASLMETVIRSFHPTAQLPEDEGALASTYQDVLREKRVLILLDNAKDVAQARPLIPPPGSTLIVTSRTKFIMGNTKPHDVGRLPEADAIALLRELCPDLSQAHALELAGFCAGLPLALRLAGAHVALDGVGSVPGYLQALRSGPLPALDADAPDAGEITIAETLRLSEEQLEPAHRAAWRALSIFSGPFDERAATAVLSALMPCPSGLLSQLSRRSLLETASTGRYVLHDLAADYALRQLDAPTQQTLRLAHAQHYTTIGAEADRHYLQGQPVAGLALFDAERQHIEAAYHWLCGQLPEGESLASPSPETTSIAKQLVELVGSIAYTSDLRFHPRQLIAWLQSELHAAHVAGDPQSGANALGNLGLAYTNLGQPKKAIPFYKQALLIAREIGDRRGEGADLGNLGLAHLMLREPHKAIALNEQQLLIAREIRDRRGEGNALGNLGLAHQQLGAPQEAIEYYKQALDIARETGDRRGEGNALGNLGLAHMHLGELRKATEFYEQQLVIVREIGDRNGEGNALFNSALAHNTLGDRREAVSQARKALPIFEAVEDPNETIVREHLAKWEAGA